MDHAGSLRSAILPVLLVGLSAGCSPQHTPTAPQQPPTPGWTLRAPMPTGRHGLAVGVVDSTLYAIGGLDSNGVDLAIVEAYDPAMDRWSARAPMPTARHGLAAGVINGIIYAVGGRVGASASAVVEAYDPQTNTWSTRASMPTARSDLAAAVAGGRLYIVGGRIAATGVITGAGSAVVESYDPATDSWRAETPMPTARWGLAAGTASGAIFALGGFDGSTSGSQVVERFDPPGGTWSSPGNLAVPRGLLAAGVTTDTILIVGGTLANYHQSRSWWEQCSFAGGNCTFDQDVPQATEDLAVGVIHGKLYAVGGSYISGSTQPDVLALHSVQELTP